MALVDKFERELKEVQAKLNAVKEFPDLEEVKDRWGIIRLATNTVNEKSIEFEVRPACDCCSGVTVYAIPYIEYEGVRLYSKTPAISFAKRYTTNNIHVYLAEDDWDDRGDWAEFNGLLLDKIAEWLDDHDADINDEDMSDDDE